MKINRISFFVVIFVFSSLIASCAGGTPSNSSVESKAGSPASSSKATQENIFINDAGDLVLDADKVTLLVYQGEARISKDQGQSWDIADTGASLQPEDEVDLSADGLALIVYPQVGILRLEGNAEYKLMEATYDQSSGDIKIASRIFNGAAMFEINPLPTENSEFSLGFTCGLIQVRFDSTWEKQANEGNLVDSDNSIITAGIATEDSEIITHFRGPVDIFQLACDGQQHYALQIPSFTDLARSVTVQIPKIKNMEYSEEIEKFLSIYDYLLAQYTLGRTPEFSGYHIVGEEQLKDERKVIFFNSKNQNLEDTASVLFRNVALKPIVGMLGGLINVLNDPANLGSDAFTGTGSSLPEGCNPQNGDGCALITGCNPITAQRCVQTPLDNNTMIIKDGKLNIQKGTTKFMPILPFSFGKKPDCFFSPPNWVCDNTSCWVCVSPDPKMGTPPEGWQPCHPACCCEPGARGTKP